MGNAVTGFCRIKDQRIVVDNQEILQGTSTFDDFFMTAYSSLQIDYPKFFKMDNLSKAGFLASEIMIRNHGFRQEYPNEEVAVVLSNCNSSLDTDLKYLNSMKKIASPALFVYTLPNIVTGEICIRNKFNGENAFFIHKSFNPEFMVSYVDILLNSGMAACLTGWVDVLGEKHDVFLYLVEKTSSGDFGNHSSENLLDLYTRF